MTKTKFIRYYGIYIFVAVVILLNFLHLLMLPLTQSLRVTGSPLLIFFNYLFKFFDGALIFIGVGTSVVLLQRRSAGYAALSLSILIYSKLLGTTLGIFFTSNAIWYHNMLSVLLQILLYIFLYVGLTVLLYVFFLRFDKTEEPKKWGFGNMFFAANLLMTGFTFLFQLILKIYDVFLFIDEDLYGDASVMTNNELLLIIFEFVFILLSAIASYFLIYLSEKLTIIAFPVKQPATIKKKKKTKR